MVFPDDFTKTDPKYEYDSYHWLPTDGTRAVSIIGGANPFIKGFPAEDGISQFEAWFYHEDEPRRYMSIPEINEKLSSLEFVLFHSHKLTESQDANLSR